MNGTKALDGLFELWESCGEILTTPVNLRAMEKAAAAMEATGKGGTIKRLDTLTSQQLEYIVEHSSQSELVDCALMVLEHDHNMPRPKDGE
jgi:hypothetical protein